jgi:hypothetical protein
VLQKRQKYAIRLMIFAQRIKTDAIVRASGQHRMRQGDLSVVKDNNGDVLKRDRHRVSSCSMASEKCSRRKRAGREIIRLRQPMTRLRTGEVNVTQNIYLEFFEFYGGLNADAAN